MISRPINILFIIDVLCAVGGTETHLLHLASNLPRDVFRCHVVAFDLSENPVVEKMREAGVPVTHMPVGREYTPAAFRRARELAAFIRAHGIDIVQTYHQKADTFGALAARYAGVRFLISSKRDMGQNRNAWHHAANRALRGLFDRVIVVADAVGEMAVSRLGVDPSRIVRLYNGVDTEEFSPATEAQRMAERSGLGLAPDDFVVGMVANFRPEKNHHVLFEAASRLRHDIPTLKVLAVGGGPLLPHYRSLYSKNGMARDIVFTGPASGIVRYLRAMDAACLVPGKNEGFSNSVMEKMAVGLPLVVTDVGGNAEAVMDRVNGFVIRPDDAGALADALLALYRDPAARKHMGEKSRELVEQRYTVQEMCRRHAAFYLSLFEGKA